MLADWVVRTMCVLYRAIGRHRPGVYKGRCCSCESSLVSQGKKSSRSRELRTRQLIARYEPTAVEVSGDMLSDLIIWPLLAEYYEYFKYKKLEFSLISEFAHMTTTCATFLVQPSGVKLN
jgi:hypothetical protein